MDFIRRGSFFMALFFIIGADNLVLKAQAPQAAYSLQEQSINNVNDSIEIIAESVESFALALEKNIEGVEDQKKLHERRKLYFFLCKIVLSGIAIGGICYVLFNYLKFKFPDFNFRLPDFNFKMPNFGLSSNSEDGEKERDQDLEGTPSSVQDESIVSCKEFNDLNVQVSEVQSVTQTNAHLVDTALSVQDIRAEKEDVTSDEGRATISSESLYSSTKVRCLCNWHKMRETREQIAYAREVGYLP